MKQTKLWLTTIAALLCSLTASAHNFEVGGIYYDIISSADLTVSVTYQGDYSNSYYNEYSGAVTIPSTVTYNSKTYSVTGIGSSAFSGCRSLTSITIPEGVTSIGSSAFWYCTSLTSITFPESVTSIGSGAFSDTAWYDNQPDGVVYAGKVLYDYKGTMPENTSIEVKEGTVSIGERAFSNCSGLTSITIPESVTSIGDYAFYNCSSLTSITIPEGVTSIGNDAFSGCSSLTSITIPEGVTSIEDSAFAGCRSLTSIIVEKANSIYDSRNDCNAIIETSSNALIIGCSTTVIPESVTSIGERAFSNCTGLTSITIPEGVTSIGNRAFFGCTGLTSITCKAEMLPTIDGSDTFYDVSKSIPVYVPANFVADYQIAKVWKEFSNIKPITCLLTYMLDGEVYKTQSIAYGSAVTPIPAPTKEGYTFSGWSEVPETMPANDVVISGAFAVNKYLITFKIGDEVIAADSLEYGATIIAPEVSEKEGYTFSGWSEVLGTMPGKDLIIEGRYTANEYLLSFSIDGALYEMRRVRCDEAIAPLDVAEKVGHTLIWENWTDKMPAKDYTIRGTYTPNKYAVIYMADGVTVHTDSIAYGEAIPEYIYEPTGEGDVFEGWVGETYETMPAHDVTYVANITNGIDAMSTVNGQQTTVIYDLTGRKVTITENLKGGVYIVNGRKVVVNNKVIIK